MILSQKNIEEIAAAVTKDFNEFFYGNKSEDTRRMARGTPIDQFAKDYLGMSVSFATRPPGPAPNPPAGGGREAGCSPPAR